jgi:hypothetical protein
VCRVAADLKSFYVQKELFKEKHHYLSEGVVDTLFNEAFRCAVVT